MASVAGVWAMRLGMMKGTGEPGLPRVSSTSPNGCLSTMRKRSADGLSIVWVAAASRLPMGSRCSQRASEATTSSPVTGVPSWNFRPGRSVKV